MKVSFAPLKHDAVDYLGFHTGIPFGYGAPFQPPNWFCVTARNDEGEIMGVLACEWKTWFEVWFNTAITDPRCMSRRLLKAIFTALFSQARRVTAFVWVENQRAIRQMKRMGFVYEGYSRLGVDGIRDAYVYGMLKEDCKYLPGYAGGTTKVLELSNGQVTQAS
jgi:hypothetical protein